MCWVLAAAVEVVSVAPVVAAVAEAQTVTVDVLAVVERTDSQVFLADSGSC